MRDRPKYIPVWLSELYPNGSYYSDDRLEPQHDIPIHGGPESEKHAPEWLDKMTREKPSKRRQILIRAKLAEAEAARPEKRRRSAFPNKMNMSIKINKAAPVTSPKVVQTKKDSNRSIIKPFEYPDKSDKDMPRVNPDKVDFGKIVTDKESKDRIKVITRDDQKPTPNDANTTTPWFTRLKSTK